MRIRTTKQFRSEIEKLGGKIIRDNILTEVCVDGIEGNMNLYGDGKYHIVVTKRGLKRKELYSESDDVWKGYEELIRLMKELK